jgi:hypothetical protein
MTGINKTDAIAEDRYDGSWVPVSKDSKNEEKHESNRRNTVRQRCVGKLEPAATVSNA